MNNDINFDIPKLINYWTTSSDNDYSTMSDLFATKHYNWSLFLGHLVIEKLLKTYYIQTQNTFPPLIHDLRRIGELAGLEFDDNKKIILDTISRFNINARYDDYKANFYKLCTKEFTEKWITQIKEIRQWIKTTLLK